jgi:hypothetical protein
MAFAPNTTRGRILAEFERRVSMIRRTSSFATDAGRLVFIGEAPDLGPDDPDHAVAVIPGNTAGLGDPTLGKVGASWPILVAALARMSNWQDASRAWMLVEAVIGDVVRAIETEDRTLGGFVPGDLRRGAIEALGRAEGTMTVGLSITYDAPYHTAWGTA